MLQVIIQLVVELPAVDAGPTTTRARGVTACPGARGGGDMVGQPKQSKALTDIKLPLGTISEIGLTKFIKTIAKKLSKLPRVIDNEKLTIELLPTRSSPHCNLNLP